MPITINVMGFYLWVILSALLFCLLIMTDLLVIGYEGLVIEDFLMVL